MIELKDYKLTDLVDTLTLRDLQESYAGSTGMECFITDGSGRPVVSGSKVSETFKKLIKMSSGVSMVLSTHAGISIIDAPIMLGGKELGHLYSGQVLTEEPSDATNQSYASELGMTKGEYSSMASSLSIVPELNLRAHAGLAEAIAKIISQKAQAEQVKLLSSDDSISGGNTANMVAKLSEAENLVVANSNAMEKLRNEFTQLETIATQSVSDVNSSKETIKVIQDVALNTRILGFNAYIEAARAKEYGKSFGVITQEIRDLADKSKESADKIEDAMVSISRSTTQIDTQIRNTERLISDCVSNIQKFSGIINSIMSGSSGSDVEL
jgi:YesN/AraC family two-component response regulator